MMTGCPEALGSESVSLFGNGGRKSRAAKSPQPQDGRASERSAGLAERDGAEVIRTPGIDKRSNAMSDASSQENWERQYQHLYDGEWSEEPTHILKRLCLMEAR